MYLSTSCFVLVWGGSGVSQVLKQISADKRELALPHCVISGFWSLLLLQTLANPVCCAIDSSVSAGLVSSTDLLGCASPGVAAESGAGLHGVSSAICCKHGFRLHTAQLRRQAVSFKLVQLNALLHAMPLWQRKPVTGFRLEKESVANQSVAPHWHFPGKLLLCCRNGAGW